METKLSELSSVGNQFNAHAPRRPGESVSVELELSLIPIEEDRPEKEIRNDRQLWAATPPSGKPFTFGK